MNKLKLVIISLSLVLASGISSAVSISGNAQLQSDYTWRGMTQNNGDASVNGGLDAEFDSGIYVGTWVAAVGTGAEVDYYGGYAGSIGEIGYDIGYVKFDYPGVAGGGSDFEESYIGLDLPMGVGISAAFGEDTATDNLEVSYGFDLGEGSVGLSYGEYDEVGDYFYITYDLSLGDFGITLGYTEFDGESAGSDEDAFFINVGLL
jgi:uncharacterized protein (TIGR02001 family)